MAEYDEEWQFALLELNSISNDDLAASLDFPRMQDIAQSSNIGNAHVHSLTTVHVPGNRRITRVLKRQVVTVNPQKGTLVIDQATYHLSELQLNRALRKAVEREIRDHLFPTAARTHSDLGLKSIVVTSNEDAPFMVFKSKACLIDPAQRCEPESGIDYNLARVLSKSLNFT